MQHQLEQCAIEQVHLQPNEPRPLQQHALQVTQPTAIEMKSGAVFRQARGLQARLGKTIVTTCELDATHAQGRPQPLHQLDLERTTRLALQALVQCRPAGLQHFSVTLEKLAHGLSFPYLRNTEEYPTGSAYSAL
ncbi:hypothetical protein D3C75_1103360 [compost metagenome]